MRKVIVAAISIILSLSIVSGIRVACGYYDGDHTIVTDDGEAWGYTNGGTAGRRIIIFNTHNTRVVYDDAIIYTL